MLNVWKRRLAQRLRQPPRTHFHLIHHSLDNNTEPSWTWLVVASFMYLTLIMQSDGCAGMVFTLNPRLRCAGTSGIQLHHNWTTLVRQNAIYTSMVLKPDTFHPIRLWNSQWKMIHNRWNWLSVHTRCRIIDHFDWRWMVTFERWPLIHFQGHMCAHITIVRHLFLIIVSQNDIKNLASTHSQPINQSINQSVNTLKKNTWQ